MRVVSGVRMPSGGSASLLEKLIREAGFSVEEWWQAKRKARLSPQRIFVVMHSFGGERRSEDVQAFVERFAEEAGISVLMATIDLSTDYRWDLAREDTKTLTPGYDVRFCRPRFLCVIPSFSGTHENPAIALTSTKDAGVPSPVAT